MSKATLIGVLLIAATSSGCGFIPSLDKVILDKRKDYTKAETLPDLEVPPELSTEAIRDRMAIPEGGEAARYSTYQERRAEVRQALDIEKSQTSAIRVLENEHVLAVAGAPVQVWPKLESFWQANGYTLDLNDVDLGIIETAWLEDETRLVRSKFKVFAETGEEAGTTVLYVSHEGQELLPQGEDLVWQRGPRDVEAERTLVEALQAEMGAGSNVASRDGAAPPAVVAADPGDAAPGAEVESDSGRESVDATPAATGTPRHAEIVSVGGGKFYLTVAEDFPRAWKTTGRALEDAGVDVKDSDKGRGVYIVEVKNADAGGEGESGVWGKLKFWDRGDAAEYQVSLTGVGPKTEVVVLDKDGRWETGNQAGLLLNKLHDVLNSGRI